MTDTQQLGLAGRLFLWILGTALFFVIALLPYAMYMRFATESTVHVTVLAMTGVIFMVLWITTTFGPLRVGPIATGTRAPKEYTPTRPVTIISNLLFILVQIVVIPLAIIGIISLLAGFPL